MLLVAMRAVDVDAEFFDGAWVADVSDAGVGELEEGVKAVVSEGVEAVPVAFGA